MVGAIGGSYGVSATASLFGTGGAQDGRAQPSGTARNAGGAKGTGTGAGTGTGTGSGLSASDQDLLTRLKARDADVRAHEQAHRSAGGQYAGAATFTYQKGPDGGNYAIGGEVSIDTSAIPNDPAGTIAKEARIQAAALAPADPSGQDVKVAASAAAAIASAEAAQAGGGTGGAGKGQTENGAKTGTGSGAGTDAGSVTAAAANAQNGGGFNAFFSRGLAAYRSAAGLGGAPAASGTSVYA